MKMFLFLIASLPLFVFAQMTENEKQISFQVNSKVESDLLYKMMNLQESWVKVPGAGMYLAKIYQEPTGAFNIRCDQINELKHTCQVKIQKEIENQNIQYLDEEKSFSVILLDPNEIQKMWDMINMEPMDHGSFQFKVVANESSDFSLMCIRNPAHPEKTMCEAKIVR